MAEYLIPLRLISAANAREHWGKRHRRIKRERAAGLLVKPHPLPCVVTIIRHGPKRMDDDNLVNAAKGLRDGIADRLGVDDADPRVTWRYKQATWASYAVTVRIEPR